jgi:hypothetical protein
MLAQSVTIALSKKLRTSADGLGWTPTLDSLRILPRRRGAVRVVCVLSQLARMRRG